MDLDDDEKIYTKINNGTISWQDFVEYCNKYYIIKDITTREEFTNDIDDVQDAIENETLTIKNFEKFMRKYAWKKNV